jgi:hypothetical protein
MNAPIIRLGCALALLLFCHAGLAAPQVHHDLEITLQPAEGRLKVQDTIILPAPVLSTEFSLHKNLRPAPGPGFTLTPMGEATAQAPVPVSYFRVAFTAPTDRFTLSYEGVIQHSLEQMSQDYGGDLAQTPGLITADGVFLSIASRWFPLFGDEQLTFSLCAKLPPGWSSVSQGSALECGGWRETSPQDDIYLIAAPYQLYRQATDVAEAMVFLRQPEPAMAKRYLEATSHYLGLYSRLLGDYPYQKFALVENFWETGYGMPSFTLLGPTVIRLPFIIHSSYPHEILHNWWGNGVYVDYGSGNWSEGLTSYLADHLLREQQGQGADYRRTSLQRYADFIAEQQDFPLTAFRGRHGQASQAIGYGKTLMFLHMLRRQLGDGPFLEGLRKFYQDNLFRVAGFADLQRAFEAASGQALGPEFGQWTQRTGAPSLQLTGVEVTKAGSGYTLEATLRQTQAAPAFRLQVPIELQLEGEAQPLLHLLPMEGKEAKLALALPARPLRIKVDPRFDLFRRLDPSEIPSSLGQLFGAERVLIVLPSAAPAEMKGAYQTLAEGWAARGSGLEVVWDHELERLPADRAVWLFGSENRWLETFLQGAKGKPLVLEKSAVTLAEEQLTRSEHSFALTTSHPADPRQTIGWIAAPSAAAVPLLGRKLPHYMKYSYLAFQGEQVKNNLKGQWPLANSALSVTLPGGENQPDLAPAPRPPLSALLDEGGS